MLKKKKRKISNAGSSAERKAIRKNIRGYNKDIKKMLKKKKERSPTLAHPQKEKPSGKISE